MAQLKWFDIIHAAEAADAAASRTQPDPPLAPFDLNLLGPDSGVRRRLNWAVSRFLLVYFRVARQLWPFPPLPQYWRGICVTRAADVDDVLTRSRDFHTPFGPEMTELVVGSDGMLGMDDLPHEKQRAIGAFVFDRDGDLRLMETLSKEFAANLIAGAGGRIDVLGDLVTRVVTEVCARYFGFELEDPDEFARWTMSLSALLFADPGGNPAYRTLALNGAARIRLVMDAALEKARRLPPGARDALVDRLVRLQADDPDLDLTDAEIRAVLMTLLVGQVPTNTLAAGRIFQELRRRPRRWREAVRAAHEGDDGTLGKIIWEAARLNPALQPGQWRIATRTTQIGGGWRRRTVRKGQVFMVCTLSALRDRRRFRRPDSFDLKRAERGEPVDFMFGRGPHACMGKAFAETQLLQVFKALLVQPKLKPAPGSAGGVAWVGPFPVRMDVVFDCVAGSLGQSLITICAPLAEGVDRPKVERMLKALGNPAHPSSPIRTALDDTGIVHFAAIALLEPANPKSGPVRLLIEIAADGARDDALRTIAEATQFTLGPVVYVALASENNLYGLLRDHCIDGSGLSPGQLQFLGTGEFPVGAILTEEKVATFARDALNHFLRRRDGLGRRAYEALDFVRRLLAGDAELAVEAIAETREARELAALMQRGEALRGAMMWPRQRRPKFPEIPPVGPWTLGDQLSSFLASNWGRVTARWIVSLFAVFAVLNYAGIGVIDLAGAWAGRASPGDWWRAMFGIGPGAIGFWVLPGRIGMALTCALVELGFLTGCGLGLLLFLLRRAEARDIADDRPPTMREVRAAARVEDPPGYAQNHFMATPVLKPGLLRRITLGAALTGTRLLISTRFRPGFVLNMGTIHYAQWVKIPGSSTFLFSASYDGSWQSYLEDFITKAHQGQTAVWSNCIGFPKTHDLQDGGAADGDRFKRWVRRQQQIALFWYSRYPHLSTTQIRNNALIHFGLMRARDDTAARDWLARFGSMGRPADLIETQEVQSLVFSGMPTLPFAAFLGVAFPAGPDDRQAWLQAVLAGAGGAPAPLFGDAGSSAAPQAAAFIAFSARGLEALGLSGPDGSDGLATFPGAFNIGMAGRARIVGDQSRDGWSDHSLDAVLLVYGATAAMRDAAIAAHGDQIVRFRGRLVAETISDPLAAVGKYRREPFGFIDGISQPVIQGARRASDRVVPARDVVEPGEFILGYPDNDGYFPPALTVRPEWDPSHALPTVPPEFQPPEGRGISEFPDFDAPGQLYRSRDFGRNGAFLAIRQLAQDVEGFEAYTRQAAREIALDYPRAERLLGEPVTADWVAAKLVGRNRDGTPLAGRGASASPDNDFAYGEDDPVGLRCPLGAHIRRANPRDGLNPGDPAGQLVTNRHRLLRRGRPYRAGSEQGLVFVGLCADIERQFEFLQQTWLGSPNFAGLTQEPDPLTGRAEDRRFTIPTTGGPVCLRGLPSFVTAKAGGYFFAPSRSALQYLATVTRARAAADVSPPPAAAPDAASSAGASAIGVGRNSRPQRVKEVTRARRRPRRP